MISLGVRLLKDIATAWCNGPMNLVNILDFWWNLKVEKNRKLDVEGQFPKEITSQATSPLYAGEPNQEILDPSAGGEGSTQVKVMSDDGTICTKGGIQATQISPKTQILAESENMSRSIKLILSLSQCLRTHTWPRRKRRGGVGTRMQSQSAEPARALIT